MSARITGDEVRQGGKATGYLNNWPGLQLVASEWPRALANQVDADEREKATLATRLAEAERERDAAKTNADAVWAMAVSGSGGVRCTWCGLVDLSEVQGREHTKSCPQNPMVAELARLRPLAAEAEAWEKIKAHPMRLTGYGFGYYAQPDGGLLVECFLMPDGKTTATAPTAVALLEKLDALVPKPEPEDWRWMWPDGSVSESPFPSLRSCREYWDDKDDRGRPMRRTVDPTTGVVTLTPAKEGV